jgi:pimeloyl-ACP methyl ester carboxylesterase
LALTLVGPEFYSPNGEGIDFNGFARAGSVLRFKEDAKRKDSEARSEARVGVVGAVILLFFVSGCSTNRYITQRSFREHALSSTLNYFSPAGPKISERTVALLRRYDLLDRYEKDPAETLAHLQETDLRNPQQLFAIAEISYILGHSAQRHRDAGQALQYFGTALMASYRYLLGPELADQRNVFDPQFRSAADLYNETLEDSLRLLCAKQLLKPGEKYLIRAGEHQLTVRTQAHGAWRPDDFSHFKFVSDYRIEQLRNRHTSYGLGVPLIAVRSDQSDRDPAASFYPDGLSFAVTALLTCPISRHNSSVSQVAFLGDIGPRPNLPTCLPQSSRECVLELHDPLAKNHVEVGNRLVPLQSDLTTPLAFFLDSPQFQEKNMATKGLLDPESRQEARGLFMLEPLDPERIPVLMVHGLWSSPLTWMDMFNDLRSFPEIRERYQFWFYVYPTGQPFWISAVQLRNDLKQMRERLDADQRMAPLDQMVLVGHSMGGLVSRLQTIDSGDDFWQIVSDRPIEELKGENEDKVKLASTLYFKPNSSVRRVITIGTPHRGSDYANSTTRWLGRKFITIPGFVRDTGSRLSKENPGFFKDTELLTTTTSIDSLAPESPIFPVMLRARPASWVKMHNIAGVTPDDRFLSKLSTRGDGVVSLESASLDEGDCQSQKIVEGDHTTLHTTPEAILEVRRILLEHLVELDQRDRVATSEAPPQGSIAPVNGIKR